MSLPLASGDWVYLYAFQDVGNRQAVGWQVGARCLKNCGQCLTTGSLDQPPVLSLLLYSDQSRQ
jgi:putative transposase